MRWLILLARIVGWLLTPLVAWAASLWGAWLVLTRDASFASPRHALYAALGTGLVLAVIALLFWIELLRRSPRLRHSLHVTREGLPDLEDAVATTDPAPIPPPSTTEPGP
ncbi:MAG: hypothetical protein KA180_03270 [Gemmatimonadales bacterium]|nr:hypothetical protein [Gemmatimonadota bacterium]MBK7783449.1 hypothetical protein [Gemmatimonadota bacterium]MBP6668444.1 hypothetical protein [Gemmatimonadales bacterium]MBP9199442.1 hypothetical protein [Gemmatimonadales bacterium]